MAKYRKIPVEVEATVIQLGKKMPKWLVEKLESKEVTINNEGVCIIETLEGNMTADKGDYIIRGVKGEIYPCKPDIFEMTYEKVEEE